MDKKTDEKLEAAFEKGDKKARKLSAEGAHKSKEKAKTAKAKTANVNPPDLDGQLENTTMHTPPEHLQAMRSSALKYQAEGQFDKALLHWRAFLLRAPDDLGALHNMALTLRSLERIAEAEATLMIALERHPGSAVLWMNLAATLDLWGKTSLAREAYETAIALDEGIEASLEYTDFLVRYGHIDDAQGILTRIIAQLPENPDIPVRMGDMLRISWQLKEAESAYESALAIQPDYSPALLGRALCQLSSGNFTAQAWDGFEKRQRLQELVGHVPIDRQPEWDGSPLGERVLLVKCASGFAETLQFMRMLHWIKGETIWVDCHTPLRELIRTARFPVKIVGVDGEKPHFDCWCSLLSLGHLLQVTPMDLDGFVPYIRHDPASLSRYRARLGSGIHIGIAWEGGVRSFGGGARTLPLSAFAPLAALTDVRLVSLQKGNGREAIEAVPFGIIDFTNELDEGDQAFVDTVTLIKALTMVITTDNAIAHLAGALGVPVWVVLPEGADWCWGSMSHSAPTSDSPDRLPPPIQPRETTPWYPTMDLCYRQAGEAWQAVFARLQTRLRGMM